MAVILVVWAASISHLLPNATRRNATTFVAGATAGAASPS
jgi:hypothetical protein